MSYHDPNQMYQQGYGQQQQQGGYPPPPQPQYGGHPGQQHGHYQQQPHQYQQPPPPGPNQGQQQWPQQQQQQPMSQSAPPEASDSGAFGSISYTVKHRNTNSTLNVQLSQQGDIVKSKPGAMIHMSPSVTLQGKIKVSFRKLFTGSELAETTYTGPGTVALAPTLFGDIVTLSVAPNTLWNVGKDAYLASTAGVEKTAKSQGIGKALFSGEDLFVYKVTGNGIIWLTSYGAIEAKHLQQGEQHIVDNGHLVAWNCEYKIEKAGGGSWQSMKSGEGLVCRFTGPGTVYIQTRNLDEFSDWVKSQVPSSS